MLLSCRNLGKTYGGVPALDGVSFELKAGEALGVAGANGAGKSTLMKCLSGAVEGHEGEVRLDGEPLAGGDPREALRRGVVMVYQELSGVGSLSVAENLLLGRLPSGRWGRIRWNEARRQAREALSRVGLEVDVTRRLDALPLAARQLVEIARGLAAGGRVLILDEPTSALSPPEAARLFELVRSLRAEGKAILLVSHFIEDLLSHCDSLLVLASGRTAAQGPAAGFQRRDVIHAMLGGAGEEAFEGEAHLPPRPAGEPLLRVRGFTRRGFFENIDLDLWPGECLALYGYAGAGHQELAHALAGASPPERGEIAWEGRRRRWTSPRAALRDGVAFVPADRGLSLVKGAEVYKNLTLAHLRTAGGSWLTRRRETAAAAPVIGLAGVRPSNPMLPAGSLSGGNQQKVVFGKWLLGPARALVLEEPTRGMDVGAKAEVMALAARLRSEGTAVILATCEPELALAHATRVAVMSRGRIAAVLENGPAGKAGLLHHAQGE